MKLPGILNDHPLESLFALALLFCLLFVAADGTQPMVDGGTRIAASEKN